MSTKSVVRLILAVALVAGASGLLLRAADPQQVGKWAPGATVADTRSGAASAVLDDGTTIVLGGRDADGNPTAAVSVYDPVTNGVTVIGQLSSARVGHTASLLADGRIAVIGGSISDVPTADIEIFDPATGTSSFGGQLPQARTRHAAATLKDGRVVIVGGNTPNADGTGLDVLATAELYDPATGSTSPVPGSMSTGRAGASATTLIDGRVLIAGGYDQGGSDLNSAELFLADSAGAFDLLPTTLSVARSGHSAILLPHNNSVLIAGGTSANVPVDAADLLLPTEFPDPFSYGQGTLTPTGSLTTPRARSFGGPKGDDGLAYVAGGGVAGSDIYSFATIKSDKNDYAPGEKAVFTGSGWQPGQPVVLVLQEDPAVHSDYVIDKDADGNPLIVADANGNIYYDQWAPEQHDLDVRFYMMAKQGAVRAQTTFTDGNLGSVSLDAPTSRFVIIPTAGTNSTQYTVTVGIGGNSNSCTVNLSFAWDAPGAPTGVTGVLGASSVSGAGGSNPTTTLTITADTTAVPLTRGFTVTAANGTGCTGGSGNKTATGQITLTAATLTVNKVVVGATGNSDKFDLLVDSVVRKTDATNGEGTGVLAVSAGAHIVSEAAGTGGVQLTNYVSTISCDQGAGSGSGNSLGISVAAGTAVTCTITNTKKGHIVVDKVTVPSGDSQSFSFTTTGPNSYSNTYSLTDAATPNDELVAPGTYSVAETEPAGWDLTSSTCTSSLGGTENPASIVLTANETVTCTFTNTKATKVDPTVTTAIHNGTDHTTSVTSVALGSTVHDSVSVTGSNGTATGNVTFTFYKNDQCTGTPEATSSAVALASGLADATAFAQGPLAAGSYSFKASYEGDSNYNAKDSACEPLTVNKADPTVSTAFHNASHTPITGPFDLGTTLHDSAGVTGIMAFAPTGTVDFTFYTGGNCTTGTSSAAGSGVALSSGVADPSDAKGPLAAGNYAFKAHYNGNSNYNTADSDCEPFTVNAAPTTTTVSIPTTTPQYSDEVVLRATVARTNTSFALTGTVYFYVGASAVTCTVAPPAGSVGTAAVNLAAAVASGNADYNYTVTQQAGNYTVTACFYSSTANYTNSDDTETLTVNKEDATVAPDVNNPSSVKVGLPVTLVFRVWETYNPEPDTNAGAHVGDIDNAGLSISLAGLNGNNYGPIACAAPTIPSAPAYGDTRVFTCSLGSALAVDAYEVTASVTGNYFVGSFIDTLTIYDPTLGFVTAGGKFLYPVPNQDASYDRVSFGLVYNFVGPKKTTPKGNVVIVRHMQNGDICRFKSNGIGAPAVSGNTASFNGKGNYVCTRPDGTTYDGAGNVNLLGYVEDNGEPGSSAATVPDEVWFSVAAPNSTIAMPGLGATGSVALTGGNVQVPQPSKK